MTVRTLMFTGIAAASLATGAHAATLSDGIGLTLSRDGTSLIVSPDLSNPSASRRVALSGGDGSLNALAYRPSNGLLYGYDSEDESVYTVNTNTGGLVRVAQGGQVQADGRTVAIDTPEPAFDFNNQVDAARAVDEGGANLVFFPDDFGDDGDARRGSVLRFTDTFFVDGTPGNPQIVANAYTNAVPETDETQQFVLDARQNALGTLANNAGEVDLVGQLLVDGVALDINQSSGFDILSLAVGDNLGLAQIVGDDGRSNIFSFDLPTANADGTFADGPITASFVGSYGEITRSFAVAPNGRLNNVAPVPVPAAGFLLMAGLAGLGLMRRRT